MTPVCVLSFVSVTQNLATLSARQMMVITILASVLKLAQGRTRRGSHGIIPSTARRRLVTQIGVICLLRRVVLPLLRVRDCLLLVLIRGRHVPVVQHVDIVFVLPELLRPVVRRRVRIHMPAAAVAPTPHTPGAVARGSLVGPIPPAVVTVVVCLRTVVRPVVLGGVCFVLAVDKVVSARRRWRVEVGVARDMPVETVTTAL